MESRLQKWYLIDLYRAVTKVDKISPEKQGELFSCIRDIIDFPKPGVVYKDITPLIGNASVFKILNNHLVSRYSDSNIDFIVGIESRGFIFGAALAALLGIAFVPIRKKGKLPHHVISENYSLEYGDDSIEMHSDAFDSIEGARVLLIDDVLATGGTAKAAIKLVKDAGGELIETCFLLNLTFLNGASIVEPLSNVYSVLTVE